MICSNNFPHFTVREIITLLFQSSYAIETSDNIQTTYCINMTNKQITSNSHTEISFNK